MKITESQLRRVIQEELTQVLREASDLGPLGGEYGVPGGLTGPPFIEPEERQTFTGQGNFTYTKNDAGDWEFESPAGVKGIATQGSPAFQSIESEAGGQGSLYGQKGYAGYTAPTAATTPTPTPAAVTDAGGGLPERGFQDASVTLPMPGDGQTYSRRKAKKIARGRAYDLANPGADIDPDRRYPGANLGRAGRKEFRDTWKAARGERNPFAPRERAVDPAGIERAAQARTRDQE